MKNTEIIQYLLASEEGDEFLRVHNSPEQGIALTPHGLWFHESIVPEFLDKVIVPFCESEIPKIATFHENFLKRFSSYRYAFYYKGKRYEGLVVCGNIFFEELEHEIEFVPIGAFGKKKRNREPKKKFEPAVIVKYPEEVIEPEENTPKTRVVISKKGDADFFHDGKWINISRHAIRRFRKRYVKHPTLGKVDIKSKKQVIDKFVELYSISTPASRRNIARINLKYGIKRGHYRIHKRWLIVISGQVVVTIYWRQGENKKKFVEKKK